MAKKDLQFGANAIRRLLANLQKPESISERFAEAILKQAVQNAAARPTPQAPMAAENLTVSGSNIYPRAEGDAAEVAIGSEFGSSRFPQFQHPTAPKGLWLYPATRDSRPLQAADMSLEEVLQAAIRG